MKTISPGSVIGILGGGQLGRMTVLAAAKLGYRCHILCDDVMSPAAQVSSLVTVSDFENKDVIKHFAENVDVITIESENIPIKSMRQMGQKTVTHPSPSVLEVTQDRVKEKLAIHKIGQDTVEWRAVNRNKGLLPAIKEIGLPCILKSTTLGYDGKRQVRIHKHSNLNQVWNTVGNEAILEKEVDLRRELSVIVARRADGVQSVYPVVETRHVNHILVQTVVPAEVSATLQAKAQRIAQDLAESLGVIGLLAVELFETQDGRLLVNELAPRPHNSGHWSIDACHTSQFEQLVRAICGLPLGNTEPFANAVMENLLGEQVNTYHSLLMEDNVRVHLYGKQQVQERRKMGHVTRIFSKS